MHILMVTDDERIDRRILLEAETLIQQDHQVTLVAGHTRQLPRFEIINQIEVHRIVGNTIWELTIPDNIKKNFQSFKGVQLLKKIIYFLNITRKNFTEIFKFTTQKVFSNHQTLNFTSNEKIHFIKYFLKRIINFFSQIKDNYKWISKKESNYLTLYDHLLSYYLEQFNPDIIHVHDLPQLGAGFLLKLKKNIPLIYDAHELYPEISTLTKEQQKELTEKENIIIKYCSQVITVNSFIAEEMARRYSIGTPVVILNATNVPKNFSPDQKADHFRKIFNIPKQHKILLFQGWISKDRGLQPLVEAMTIVDSTVHLVLMGYGEGIPILQELVLKHNLEQRVHFKDTVSQDELLFWSASADIGIIPYQPIDLNNYYCSPNKLFEFIQAHLPIIANDLPFLRHIIQKENFGIVAKLTDAHSYSQAINLMQEKLTTEPNFFKENFAKRATNYLWKKESKVLKKVYEKII